MNLEDILLDTLEYYGADESRYCMDSKGNSCRYSPFALGIEEASEGCAIGRLLTPEIASKLDKHELGSIDEILQDLEEEIKEDNYHESSLLPKDVYDKLSENIDFFADLQLFHDTKKIVNGKLTLSGSYNLKEFIRRYGFNQFKFTKWIGND